MQIKEILIRAIKIGIVLVFFTPLVLGPFGLNMSEYPKAVFFRSLIEIIFVFYLFLIFLNRAYIPKKSILLFSIILFDVILIVASIAGINFYRSFFGDMQRGEGIILHLHLLALFVILISIFRKKEDWLLPLRATVIVSGLSSIAGVFQQFKIFTFYNVSPGRLSGTLSNPDFFGAYTALSIFLAIILLLAEKKRNLKILWAFFAFLNLYTLVLSGTRASWVGFAMGVVFIYLLNYKSLNYKQKLYSLFIILSIAIIMFFAPLIIEKTHLEKSAIGNRIVSIYNIDIANRVVLWDVAWRAFKDRPVLGWGFESYSYISDKYFKGDYSTGIYFDRPHNKVLEVLVLTGIVGMISYLLLFLIPCYLVLRHNKKTLFGSIFVAFFVCYFVQNISSFDNIGTYILFFLIAGFINSNFFSTPVEYIEKPDRLMSAVKVILFFDVVIFMAFVFYQVNVKPTLAVLYFNRAIKYESSNPLSALDGYEAGISTNTIYDNDLIMTFSDRAIFLLENSYGQNGIGEKAVSGLLKVAPILQKNIIEKDIRPVNAYEFLSRADEWAYIVKRDANYLNSMSENIDSALKFNNSVPIFYQIKGELGILQGKNSEGEKNIKKACDLDPICTSKGKVDLYTKIGIAYFKNSDIVSALKNFQKAVDADYSDRKKMSSLAISGPNMAQAQFIDSVAIMYYSYFKDFKNCKKVYEMGEEIYPYHKEMFEQHLLQITADYEKK